MSKMNELSVLLEELIACGNTLAKTAERMKKFYSGTEDAVPKTKRKTTANPEPDGNSAESTPYTGEVVPNADTAENTAATEPETPPAKEYKKEEVRALLAAKAAEANGRYKADVKAMVKKYGNGGSLTDVPAENYPALVEELEGMNNAG